MRCFAPMSVPNPKPIGLRFIKVPCGKCEACVMNRAQQWYVRLYFQAKGSANAVFVTLTYAPEHLPLRIVNGKPVADVSKDDVRHFLVRLRRYLGSWKSKRLKYFLVSEYGPNPEDGVIYRPHYHAIFFNLASEDYETLVFAWKKGFVTFGELIDERIRYVSGYCTEKLFCPPDVAPLFTFISNGIGYDYVDQYRDFHEGQLDRFFVPVNGKKAILPRYYKERLYSKAEMDVFAQRVEKQADNKFLHDLATFGGDVARLERRYYEQRADYVRKLNKKHKKKQNG